MQKKKLIIFSILSALIVSGFGLATAMAASSGIASNALNQADQLEKRYGITLTEEQKTQVQAKETEMESKRAEELAKWQNMTLDSWKQQEIERINATTQEQFDKMKEQHVNMLKNGKGGMGMFGPKTEKPAE
ncbi:MAG: hypothetical protein WC468_00070 [Candidatus Paceibacterota bacterium]